MTFFVMITKVLLCNQFMERKHQKAFIKYTTLTAFGSSYYDIVVTVCTCGCAALLCKTKI